MSFVLKAVRVKLGNRGLAIIASLKHALGIRSFFFRRNLVQPPAISIGHDIRSADFVRQLQWLRVSFDGDVVNNAWRPVYDCAMSTNLDVNGSAEALRYVVNVVFRDNYLHGNKELFVRSYIKLFPRPAASWGRSHWFPIGSWPIAKVRRLVEFRYRRFPEHALQTVLRPREPIHDETCDSARADSRAVSAVIARSSAFVPALPLWRICSRRAP